MARIDRVLSQPGGSLLLCGPSGTGRRSCILLSAYMHHMELYSPKMTRCVPDPPPACVTSISIELGVLSRPGNDVSMAV